VTVLVESRQRCVGKLSINAKQVGVKSSDLNWSENIFLKFILEVKHKIRIKM
jgi:hypothetical protein